MPSELGVGVSIATLGPAGTDAEYLARRLSSGVILHDTFGAALAQACSEDCVALVACGCLSETETWVDLHFRFSDSLDMVCVTSVPTKPMCFAVNVNAGKPVRTVGVYLAVRALADRYAPEATVVGFASKPAAVQACAEGQIDACIGSLDTARHCDLSIVDVIEGSMVWGLYARRGLAWESVGEKA